MKHILLCFANIYTRNIHIYRIKMNMYSQFLLLIAKNMFSYMRLDMDPAVNSNPLGKLQKIAQ